MGTPVNEADPPFGPWHEGFTATDSEFLLRASSILELGTGLHHLALMADRYVADHDSLTAAEVAGSSASASAVAPGVRSHLADQLDDVTRVYKQRIQDQLDQLDPDSTAAQITDPFEWVITQMREPLHASLNDAGTALAGLAVQDAALGSYLMLHSQALDRKPLLPTMQRALLITAVASAETMLMGVLRRLQYGQGGATRWGPLWNTPDLDKQIRRLTRGSIEDWKPRVLSDLGLNLAPASCDWDAVREVWARRNVLVHNAGLADTKYVERIPSVAVGTPLEIDSEYLRNAIDLLCGFLLGVIFMAWVVLPGRRSFVLQLFTMYATSAAAELRWPLAENLHALIAREESDKDHAAASQVNAWLARAHWRGPDSVLEAVEQWRTDDLPRRFAVARTILLREYDVAIAMLPEILESGEITKDHLLTWPLFESLRAMPNFQRLLAD
jgi:hypothetical protein